MKFPSPILKSHLTKSLQSEGPSLEAPEVNAFFKNCNLASKKVSDHSRKQQMFFFLLQWFFCFFLFVFCYNGLRVLAGFERYPLSFFLTFSHEADSTTSQIYHGAERSRSSGHAEHLPGVHGPAP